jgi:signal peptidase I
MSAVTPSDPIDSVPKPRPSRVLAGVLSFFAPGSGHVYLGRYRRGILLLLAFVLLQPVLLLAGFLVAPTFRAVTVFGIAILAALLVVVIVIVVDAIRQTRRSDGSARWYVWVGAILLCWGGFYATSLLGGAIKPQLPWRTFTIPSASMEPTLHVGEWLVADMRHYDRSAPARGDMVLYLLPSDNETIYIKRVVGLPGDRIVFRDGHTMVNGTATVEPFANFGDPKAFFNTTAEVTVPPDQLFVVGDNRANSIDSRVRQHGMVPFRNLIGRAAEIVRTEDWSRLGLWVGSPRS